MWEYFSTKFQYPKLVVDSDLMESVDFGNRVSAFQDFPFWGYENKTWASSNTPKDSCGMSLYLHHLYVDLPKSNIESVTDAGLGLETKPQISLGRTPIHNIPSPRQSMPDVDQTSAVTSIAPISKLKASHTVLSHVVLPSPTSS